MSLLKICMSGRTRTPVETNALAKYFASWGHSVDLVSVCPSINDVIYRKYRCGFNFGHRTIFHEVLTKTSFGLSSVMKIRKLLSHNRYDIIHFDDTIAPFLNMLLLDRRNMPPFVFSTMGPVPAPPQKDTTLMKPKDLLIPKESDLPKVFVAASIAVLSYNVKMASKVVVNSNVLRDTIVTCFNICPTKIAVVPSGVDSGLFRPRTASAVFRERHGLREDDFVVLYVAAISPHKNQLALIKAVPHIVVGYPNTKFVFVGEIVSKKYYWKILDFIHSHSLEKYIMLTGWVDFHELLEYYALADVFMLLSKAEGMPRVLLEAMSCGKPVVASCIPQNMEVAKRGDEVMFIAPSDIQAIAEAINNLLSSRTLRNRIGENARKTVLKHFEWEIIARQMMNVYEETLGRCSTR